MYKGISNRALKLNVVGFMEKGLKKGKSFSSIIKSLRKQGLGYRDIEMRRDLRIIAAQIDKHKGLKYINRKTVLDESYFTKTKFPTLKKYNVTFKIKAYDENTKQEKEFHMTVGTDYNKSLNDYFNNVHEQLKRTEKEGSNPLEIKSITPIKAFGWW